MAHIITSMERPEKFIIEQFRAIGTATIHEASGRKGYVDCAIKPAARGVRICGPAFTVECHPRDNLMLHKALEKALPGDIIVASVGGFPEAGYFGGLMATSAKARSLGGLAIDGCIRDSDEINRMGFPVFCRGFCILGTGKTGAGTVNHPIIFGGCKVNPGDLIMGDTDGIVVIERKDCEIVLKKSQDRLAMEDKKSEQLAAGISSVEFNKLAKNFEFLGLTEE